MKIMILIAIFTALFSVSCFSKMVEQVMPPQLSSDAQAELEARLGGSPQNIGYNIESVEQGVPIKPLFGPPDDEVWCVKLDREVEYVGEGGWKFGDKYQYYVLHRYGLLWKVEFVPKHFSERNFKLNSCSNWQ